MTTGERSNSSGAKKRGPKVDLTRKIKVIVAANPKKEGTEAFKRFGFYQDGMTVEEAIRKGVTLRDIRHDAKAKHIELTNGDGGK